MAELRLVVGGNWHGLVVCARRFTGAKDEIGGCGGDGVGRHRGGVAARFGWARSLVWIPLVIRGMVVGCRRRDRLCLLANDTTQDARGDG